MKLPVNLAVTNIELNKYYEVFKQSIEIPCLSLQFVSIVTNSV